MEHFKYLLQYFGHQRLAYRH